MSERCTACGAHLDYTDHLFRVDFQEWYLNRAIAKKMVFCRGCGERVRRFLTGMPRVAPTPRGVVTIDTKEGLL